MDFPIITIIINYGFEISITTFERYFRDFLLNIVNYNTEYFRCLFYVSMHQCRYVTKCNLRHEQFSTLCEPLASYTKLVHCNRHVNHPLLIGTSRTYLSCIGESSAAGQPAAMHDRQRITRLTIEYYSFIILFFLLFSFIAFFRSISSTYLFSRFFFLLRALNCINYYFELRKTWYFDQINKYVFKF